jgi:hypothetical protein
VTFLELKTALFNLVRWSRPTTTGELGDAANYGVTELVNVVAEARPELFMQEALVAIPANVLRVTLSGGSFPRAVTRIKAITSLGSSVGDLTAGMPAASASPVQYRYCSIESQEFQLRQREAPNDSAEVLYDLVFNGGVATLALAPARATADTALVQSIYRPARLAGDNEQLDPILERHGYEAILAYGLSWLLRTVNDVESGHWLEIAGRLTAGFVQSVSKVSEQNTEGVDTALDFGDV